MSLKRDKKAMVALTVGILLLASPIIFNYKAEAASQVTGSGTATFPNEQVFCPNGSVIPEATIEFTATETNGVISGTWTITSTDPTNPTFGVKRGTFNGGNIDTNSYTLTGTETVDEACSQFGGGVVPNPMQISGQCGTGVTINFEAQRIPPFERPESGTFAGDVTCVSEPSPPSPPTPKQIIDELISIIQNLDNVPQSVKTDIIAALEEVSDILNDNNPNNDESACGSLGVFINQVNANERRGTLTADQADDLRTQAEDIRNKLLDC